MKLNQLKFLTTIGIYGYSGLSWVWAVRNTEKYYHIPSILAIILGAIILYIYLDYYEKTTKEQGG